MKKLIITICLLCFTVSGCGSGLGDVAIITGTFMGAIALFPPPECKRMEESAAMENQSLTDPALLVMELPPEIME